MNKYIITIFWALVVNFLFIVSLFSVPAIRKPLQGSKVFLIMSLILVIIFFVLGLVLTILTFKSKIVSKLRKFLLLTGISSAGLLVSIFLHNITYGIFIYFFGANFWERIGIGDEPIFFFVAVILCPIGFLVGMVGSIVILIRRRKVI